RGGISLAVGIVGVLLLPVLPAEFDGLVAFDNLYRRRTCGDNLTVVDPLQADIEFIAPGLIPGDPEVAGGTMGEGEASGWPEPSFISLEVQFLEYVLPAAGLEVLQVEPVGVL